MGLVVAIVSAIAGVYVRWGIDSMWRRSITHRPDRYVVCLVVLIVITRRDAWVFGNSVASGTVRFHVSPSFTDLDLPPECRSNSLSRDQRPVDIGPPGGVVGDSMWEAVKRRSAR
jgi:hypothetical protein